MKDVDLDVFDAEIAEFRRLQEGWQQRLPPQVYRAVLIEVAEQCTDRIEETDDAEDEAPMHS